jgi:meso-butanediol dehydrogenase / (S,S)-butanediol dehydrogenase / diacetyl reductase
MAMLEGKIALITGTAGGQGGVACGIFAREGAPFGIRAVNVSPGAIVTREADLDPAHRAAIAARTPLKRWGRPSEIVEVAAFLASYITGANILVEGGSTSW